MRISGVSDEFLDWLEQCPVQWNLINEDEQSISYTFLKKVECDDDEVES